SCSPPPGRRGRRRRTCGRSCTPPARGTSSRCSPSCRPRPSGCSSSGTSRRCPPSRTSSTPSAARSPTPWPTVWVRPARPCWRCRCHGASSTGRRPVSSRWCARRSEPGGGAPVTAHAVVVEGLRVRRGTTTALDGVDLRVATGRVTGLLGPSGSGKTTLLRAVLGIQVVHDGTVRVLGEPAGSRGLRRRVGYMSQAPSVYEDLTVVENLRYFARVLGVGRAGVAAVLDTVDLRDRDDQLVRTLSG